MARQSIGHMRTTAYVIKTAVAEPSAMEFVFAQVKTMYGGKRVAVGDTIFIFSSENEGGSGLIARGVITAAGSIARRPGIERQAPRVNISIRRTALAKRPLGRRELKQSTNWHDAEPQTELNFKLYRQATNKLVGISAPAATFLDSFV